MPIPYKIKPNQHFIAREYELNLLEKIGSGNESSIIITYGRRRVGKTELLEQAFRERNLLKFEGIEGLSHKAQFAHAMAQLAKYTESRLLGKVAITSWREFFEVLYDYTKKGTWTIYLEEL